MTKRNHIWGRYAKQMYGALYITWITFYPAGAQEVAEVWVTVSYRGGAFLYYKDKLRRELETYYNIDVTIIEE